VWYCKCEAVQCTRESYTRMHTRTLHALLPTHITPVLSLFNKYAIAKGPPCSSVSVFPPAHVCHRHKHHTCSAETHTHTHTRTHPLHILECVNEVVLTQSHTHTLVPIHCTYWSASMKSYLTAMYQPPRATNPPLMCVKAAARLHIRHTCR
jgi:hypothetical protein